MIFDTSQPSLKKDLYENIKHGISKLKDLLYDLQLISKNNQNAFTVSPEFILEIQNKLDSKLTNASICIKQLMQFMNLSGYFSIEQKFDLLSELLKFTNDFIYNINENLKNTSNIFHFIDDNLLIKNFKIKIPDDNTGAYFKYSKELESDLKVFSIKNQETQQKGIEYNFSIIDTVSDFIKVINDFTNGFFMQEFTQDQKITQDQIQSILQLNKDVNSNLHTLTNKCFLKFKTENNNIINKFINFSFFNTFSYDESYNELSGIINNIAFLDSDKQKLDFKKQQLNLLKFYSIKFCKNFNSATVENLTIQRNIDNKDCYVIDSIKEEIHRIIDHAPKFNQILDNKIKLQAEICLKHIFAVFLKKTKEIKESGYNLNIDFSFIYESYNLLDTTKKDNIDSFLSVFKPIISESLTIQNKHNMSIEDIFNFYIKKFEKDLNKNFSTNKENKKKLVEIIINHDSFCYLINEIAINLYKNNSKKISFKDIKKSYTDTNQVTISTIKKNLIENIKQELEGRLHKELKKLYEYVILKSINQITEIYEFQLENTGQNLDELDKLFDIHIKKKSNSLEVKTFDDLCKLNEKTSEDIEEEKNLEESLNKIKILEAENENLKQENIFKDQQIILKDQQIIEFQNQLKEVDTIKEQFGALMKKFKKLQEENEELEEEKKELKKDKKELKEENIELKAEKKELEAENAKLVKKFKKLEEENEKTIDELKSILKIKISDSENLETKIKNLQKQIELQEELKFQNEFNNTNVSKNFESEEENVTASLSKELLLLRTKTQFQDNENNQLKQDLEESQKKNEQQKQELEQKQQKINQQNQEIDEKKQEIDEKKQEIDEKKQEIEEKKQEIEQKIQEIEQKIQELEGAKTEIQKLKENLEKEEKQKKELETTTENLRNNTKELTLKIKEIIAKYQALNTTHNTLQKDFKDCESANKAFLNEKYTLTRETYEAAMRIQDLEKKINNANSEISTLKQQLEENQKKLEENQKKLAAKHEELETVTQKSKETQKELEAKYKELEAKQVLEENQKRSEVECEKLSENAKKELFFAKKLSPGIDDSLSTASTKDSENPISLDSSIDIDRTDGFHCIGDT